MKRAVSFVEILVATFIVVVAIGGLMASFSAIRGSVGRTAKIYSSINLIVQELDRLYRFAGEDTWDTNLCPGGGCDVSNKTIQLPPENITYILDRNITSVAGGHDYRRVEVVLTYP